MSGYEHDENDWGFDTAAIHAGQDPDPVTGAVVVPITLSTTFAQSAPGVHGGYEYSRSGNPTRAALETCVATLEGVGHGLAFASGLAASDTVLRLVAHGGHVILGSDAYGGTFRLLDRVHRSALSWSAHDLADVVALERNWPSGTSMVWLETPTNPLLRVFDIAAVAEVAHRHGALVVVDNTFATPYLQRPAAFGADLVVHSSTKYLGGHSDVVGGFVAVADEEIATRLSYLQNAAGAVPAPFDCYMLLRGIKTLGLRMERHCDNAAAVAEFLQHHPQVGDVHYPGLLAHPQHRVAASQMRRFGGMVSFTLRHGEQAARRLVSATRLFTLAESLGAVESLIEHPASMTHASAAGSPLQVPDDLVRCSVGIESVGDLLADLASALDSLDG